MKTKEEAVQQFRERFERTVQVNTDGSRVVTGVSEEQISFINEVWQAAQEATARGMENRLVDLLPAGIINVVDILIAIKLWQKENGVKHTSIEPTKP